MLVSIEVIILLKDAGNMIPGFSVKIKYIFIWICPEIYGFLTTVTQPSISSAYCPMSLGIEQTPVLFSDYSPTFIFPLPATDDFTGSYIASAVTGGKVKFPRVTALSA